MAHSAIPFREGCLALCLSGNLPRKPVVDGTPPQGTTCHLRVWMLTVQSAGCFTLRPKRTDAFNSVQASCSTGNGPGPEAEHWGFPAENWCPLDVALSFAQTSAISQRTWDQISIMTGEPAALKTCCAGYASCPRSALAAPADALGVKCFMMYDVEVRRPRCLGATKLAPEGSEKAQVLLACDKFRGSS